MPPKKGAQHQFRRADHDVDAVVRLLAIVPPLQGYPIKGMNFPGVAPGCSVRSLQGQQPLRKHFRLALSESQNLNQALAGDV